MKGRKGEGGQREYRSPRRDGSGEEKGKCGEGNGVRLQKKR